MLRTRLWMGAVLVCLVVAMLLLDGHLAPWFPFLFLFVFGLALAACFELLHLLPPARRPPAGLAYAAVALVVAANWPAHVNESAAIWSPNPWSWVVGAYTAVVLAAFLAEMAVFQEPGESVARIATTLFIAGYLGLLP